MIDPTVRKKMFVAILAYASLLTLAQPASAASAPSAAASADIVSFNIPAQEVANALEAFAQQSGKAIMFDRDRVGSRRLKSVVGNYTPEEALRRLIDGSGLMMRAANEGTFVVGASQALTQVEAGTARLAQVDQNASEPASAQQSGQTEKSMVEEIVVTAQKRTERLQDVPVPVSVIRAETLIDSNQFRLQDYYSRIPGLSVVPEDIFGAPKLTIRGVTTGGFSNPTVGIVVDDVQYGSSTTSGGGGVAPDFDPSDLARVEVLRGPQGTLYGASSMGGLLKFVTADPSPDGLSGRVQGGISSVYNAATLGYSFRGAVNVPVSDALAIRASAFTRSDPGYIDDPGMGIDGVNSVEVNGGRLSALWRPSPEFSLRLSALLQKREADGAPYVHRLPGLGNLEQQYMLRQRESKTFQAYSATLAADLGQLALTAISAYNVDRSSGSSDYSRFYGGLHQVSYGVLGGLIPATNETDKLSQEVRVSAPLGQSAEWLLGAFFTHENSDLVQDVLAVNPATGVSVGQSWHLIRDYSFTEYAAFANLTFHVTEKFDLQIGGRLSENNQNDTQTASGLLVPIFYGVPSPVVAPKLATEEHALTYLLTPQYRLSPDLMLYARLASGYRAGGPNLNFGVGAPPSVDSDTTQNYEVGVKGNLFDQALTFDASLYFIDWKNIQVQLFDSATGIGYFDNAGSARSQGVELAVETKPREGLGIAAWVAWNDAELVEAFPATSTAYGVSEDRLPYSARFSASLSIDQEFPLAIGNAFVGGSVRYVGDREGVFTASPLRETFPAYTQIDLRGGLRFDAWSAQFFVNNVNDERGVLSGGLGTIFPFAYSFIQPRTIGVSLAKSF